jgi:hypothetical protein
MSPPCFPPGDNCEYDDRIQKVFRDEFTISFYFSPVSSELGTDQSNTDIQFDNRVYREMEFHLMSLPRKSNRKTAWR